MRSEFDRQEERTHHNWIEAVNVQRLSFVCLNDKIDNLLNGILKFRKQLMKLLNHEVSLLLTGLSVLNQPEPF